MIIFGLLGLGGNIFSIVVLSRFSKIKYSLSVVTEKFFFSLKNNIYE